MVGDVNSQKLVLVLLVPMIVKFGHSLTHSLSLTLSLSHSFTADTQTLFNVTRTDGCTTNRVRDKRQEKTEKKTVATTTMMMMAAVVVVVITRKVGTRKRAGKRALV